MKTITIRELRQKWPEAEALLRTEKELLVTRDSKPVAKLVRFEEKPLKRKRFDPKAHGKWQDGICENRPVNWVEDDLLKERDER